MSTVSIHSIIFGESNDYPLNSGSRTSHSKRELSNIIFGTSNSDTPNEPHYRDEASIFEEQSKQTRSISAPSNRT
jgi:hypothetical protein